MASLAAAATKRAATGPDLIISTLTNDVTISATPMCMPK